MTKLVCLPFAGAGASFYRPWLGLSEVFDVIAAQLPGRERRLDEEPYRSVDAAVADLLPDIVDAARPDGRVVLFGHCMGAALAYELARAIQAGGEVRIAHLVVSGSPWPAVPLHAPIAALPDDAFIERVADYTGYRHVALNNPEMRELVLPALRADVEMHEQYVPSAGGPLPVPITALRGTDDTMVPAAHARGWAGATSDEFAYLEFGGGHMYLADSAEQVMRAIETRACDGDQGPTGATDRHGEGR